MFTSVVSRYPSDIGKYNLQMHEEEKRRNFSLVRFYESHFKDIISLKVSFTEGES